MMSSFRVAVGQSCLDQARTQQVLLQSKKQTAVRRALYLHLVVVIVATTFLFILLIKLVYFLKIKIIEVPYTNSGVA